MMSIRTMMDLSGRKALLTGAAGAVGSVLAQGLAELGADLVLVDRDAASLERLAGSLHASWGISADACICDLEDEEDRDRFLEFFSSQHDTLSILINNAAFVGTSDLTGWAVPFEEQTIGTWRRAIEVNLTAPFHLCQRLAPIMRRSPGSSIVNIASIYGQFGPNWSLYEDTAMSNPAAYGTSKGGLIQLTRWLSTTLAPEIRVNAISPGGISRGQPAPFVERYEKATPLRRMAQEVDLLGAVAYLGSDLSTYVTGQTLNVDGGWGIW